MRSRHQMDDGHRRLAFVAAALFALSFVVAPLERTDATATRAPSSAEVSGTFTGETTADGPVYRLPPLHVVADRKAEYARIERDMMHAVLSERWGELGRRRRRSAREALSGEKRDSKNRN